jgi:hypothetical protein
MRKHCGALRSTIVKLKEAAGLAVSPPTCSATPAECRPKVCTLAFNGLRLSILKIGNDTYRLVQSGR